MTMEGESTPPSTPGRKGDKGRKKETPKKKTGPKLELSNKEKDILSKWPTTGYGPGEIFGEGHRLHNHEKKKVRNNIPNLQNLNPVKQCEMISLVSKSLGGRYSTTRRYNSGYPLDLLRRNLTQNEQ